jgi:hypothetical protein
MEKTLQLAFEIISDVKDPFSHWHIFSGVELPERKNGEESVFEYNNRVRKSVKALACQYIAEKIERVFVCPYCKHEIDGSPDWIERVLKDEQEAKSSPLA